MALDSVIFNLKKALGRDRGDWPVTVEKLEKRGDGFVEKTDRGRRVKNPETDQPRYEFLKENEDTASIPQSYLETDANGHPKLTVLKVQTESGAQFAPVKKSLEFTAEDVDDWQQQEDLEADMDFVVKISRFIEVGKNELERHYEITKTEDKEWYQAPIVWLVGGAVGMGIFYIMAGIGAQKVLDTTASSGASKNLVPFLAFTSQNLRNKISQAWQTYTPW